MANEIFAPAQVEKSLSMNLKSLFVYVVAKLVRMHMILTFVLYMSRTDILVPCQHHTAESLLTNTALKCQ